MELHQLQYAVEIAKYQNFTRAAEELHVSQPSLSQQITKLEDELGVKLFDRTTRFVRLTSAGQILVEHAQHILWEIEQIQTSLQAHTGTLKGKFVIGAMPVIGNLKITAMIAAFQKIHLGLDIHIVEAGSCILLEKLCQSEIDVAILTPPINEESVSLIDFYPLVDDELVLVTHRSHPLLNSGIVDLAEASGETFIFPNKTIGAYSIVLQACRNAGFEPKVACECSQLETILGLVSEGVGIALLSSRVANSTANSEIGIVRMTKSLSKPTVLAVLKNTHYLPAVTAFRDFSQKWIQTFRQSID